MAPVTIELLQRYLPNPIRKSGNEYRTWLESSRSRSHVALNLDKGFFYDFHTKRGGNLGSLLRQFGAPISKELAGSESWRAYQFQLSILKGLKSQGRVTGCGRCTAVWRDKDTKTARIVARVMCLRWNCPRCAPFLKRVWMERLSGIHFGAVYTTPKGFQDIGRLLDKVKRKAKRRDGKFIWLLLQANDYQVLFIDSRSCSEVISWLDDECYLCRVATNPPWSERNQWLEKGLEKMDKPMYWSNKVRHSRDLLSDDIVANTSSDGPISPPSDNESTEITLNTHQPSEPKYERSIVPYSIEEVVKQLEDNGYTVQWLSEEGNVAFLIPPRNGPI